jgi:hypothetical protein
MYGIYPFDGQTRETLAVAIATRKMKEPSSEAQQRYSERLKNILSSLVLQVFSYLIIINFFF